MSSCESEIAGCREPDEPEEPEPAQEPVPTAEPQPAEPQPRPDEPGAARPDGTLPAAFDDLVRESVGDVLAVGAR